MRRLSCGSGLQDFDSGNDARNANGVDRALGFNGFGRRAPGRPGLERRRTEEDDLGHAKCRGDVGGPGIVTDEQCSIAHQTGDLRESGANDSSRSGERGHMVGSGADEYRLKIQRLAEIASDFQEAGCGPGFLWRRGEGMNYGIGG